MPARPAAAKAPSYIRLLPSSSRAGDSTSPKPAKRPASPTKARPSRPPKSRRQLPLRTSRRQARLRINRQLRRTRPKPHPNRSLPSLNRPNPSRPSPPLTSPLKNRRRASSAFTGRESSRQSLPFGKGRLKRDFPHAIIPSRSGPKPREKRGGKNPGAERVFSCRGLSEFEYPLPCRPPQCDIIDWRLG
jgi:hypothetical protein